MTLGQKTVDKQEATTTLYTRMMLKLEQMKPSIGE